MSTVFVGGSRHVSRLPELAKTRLNNVVESRFPVVVGDANGADTAAQAYLSRRHYDHVTVFCSGPACRNNLGHWPIRHVAPPAGVQGFQFYAAKDREMAHIADFGLMIWDGKSPGTILNILRLVQAGKKGVLLDARDDAVTTFKTPADWNRFLAGCPADLRLDLQARATADEQQLLDLTPEAFFDQPADTVLEADLTVEINAALATANPTAVAELLGMSQVAKDTGLAREGLYRALSANGNPEFATVLKVIRSLGLRLAVGPE